MHKSTKIQKKESNLQKSNPNSKNAITIKQNTNDSDDSDEYQEKQKSSKSKPVQIIKLE